MTIILTTDLEKQKMEKQLETFCHDKYLDRKQTKQRWMDIFLGNELNLIRRK